MIHAVGAVLLLLLSGRWIIRIMEASRIDAWVKLPLALVAGISVLTIASSLMFLANIGRDLISYSILVVLFFLSILEAWRSLQGKNLEYLASKLKKIDRGMALTACLFAIPFFLTLGFIVASHPVEEPPSLAITRGGKLVNGTQEVAVGERFNFTFLVEGETADFERLTGEYCNVARGGECTEVLNSSIDSGRVNLTLTCKAAGDYRLHAKLTSRSESVKKIEVDLKVFCTEP